MSEWDHYANVLSKRFSFINTYFHTTPRLDIMSEDYRKYQDLDFVICTEVLEHVLQPISTGLAHLRAMLKPNGVLIFSVPFTDASRTQEHFPHLQAFGTCQIGGRWVVVSQKPNGQYEVFDQNVIFHGGPGTVLEMRLFGQDDLRTLLQDSGFSIKVYSQPVLDIGYAWLSQQERAGAGRNLSYIIEARPR